MALVAYGPDSDSEENTTSDDENINGTTKNKNIDAEKVLFDGLPQPKNATPWASNGVEEEDDEFLKKKEKATETPPASKAARQPVKIYLPSLSSFQEEDDDDDRPRPVSKKPTKGSGLLNILPKPKSTEGMKKPTTSFIPNILNKVSAKPPTNIRTTKKVTPAVKKSVLVNDYDSDDSSDEEKSADFFSLNKKDDIESIPMADIEESSKISIADNIKNVYLENDYDSSHAGSTSYEQVENVNIQTSFDNSETTIDDEAVRKLSSNRERRKGEAVQFIDINQSEIMPDTNEWLIKALTDDNCMRVPSCKRKGEEPTNQQKRKHQITYLAHQARVNEQNLKNQWANNRLTRKQTQSKYGF